ncbi:hypothetical protein MMC07_007420, partial [Pseudocyphellaria aurata]|nr:hypothetical protein [Pseudocyphellaria aurata]
MFLSMNLFLVIVVWLVSSSSADFIDFIADPIDNRISTNNPIEILSDVFELSDGSSSAPCAPDPPKNSINLVGRRVPWPCDSHSTPGTPTTGNVQDPNRQNHEDGYGNDGRRLLEYPKEDEFKVWSPEEISKQRRCPKSGKSNALDGYMHLICHQGSDTEILQGNGRVISIENAIQSADNYDCPGGRTFCCITFFRTPNLFDT